MNGTIRLKPWQIALAVIGSIVVIGGTATGIGLTVAHNNELESQLADISVQAAEALDQITETQTVPLSEVETVTTTESISEKRTTTTTATPTTEPTTQEKITWTYDEKLSKELGKLIEAKFPGYKYDSSLFEERGPGHYINNGIIKEQNEDVLYIGNITPGNDIAKKLLNAWTQVDIKQLSKKNSSSFCIAVYKYSNGYYFISAC